MTNHQFHIDRLPENSSLVSRGTKFPSTSSECVVSRPPDIPERIPIRSRTGSGQQILTVERPPSRNTPVTSSVRLPSTSLDKIPVTNGETKLFHQLDFEVDRSPLLNHSIQIDKSQIGKTRPRNLPTKRLSNPSNEETVIPSNDDIQSKISSTEQITSEMID